MQVDSDDIDAAVRAAMKVPVCDYETPNTRRAARRFKRRVGDFLDALSADLTVHELRLMLGGD